MLSLSSIESDLTVALKARDSLRVNTLRALKTRIQNEQISAMADLDEAKIIALIRSEVKRRKEAATAFTEAGRTDSATQELDEAKILESYLPAGPTPELIAQTIEKIISENNFASKDFGAAMGKVKAALPEADGSSLAASLKEKLK